MPRAVPLRLAALAALSLALPACGDNEEGVPDQILDQSLYEARCASPRSGIDPGTDARFPDTEGSLLAEQLWVRSWINDSYLWYSEVSYTDPRLYADAVDYFDDLRTPAKTPSGKDKDQFHFIY
ncbi:MAG TPA: hypothetical protein VK601_06965, partial [Kofleriaceae bacterium]|nr:hypothetical protein [Kofleriaceae bacterium]